MGENRSQSQFFLVNKYGQELPLLEGRTVLGRGPLLRINDTRVSRQQVEVIIENDEMFLKHIGKYPMSVIEHTNAGPIIYPLEHNREPFRVKPGHIINIFLHLFPHFVMSNNNNNNNNNNNSISDKNLEDASSSRQDSVLQEAVDNVTQMVGLSSKIIVKDDATWTKKESNEKRNEKATGKHKEKEQSRNSEGWNTEGLTNKRPQQSVEHEIERQCEDSTAKIRVRGSSMHETENQFVTIAENKHQFNPQLDLTPPYDGNNNIFISNAPLQTNLSRDKSARTDKSETNQLLIKEDDKIDKKVVHEVGACIQEIRKKELQLEGGSGIVGAQKRTVQKQIEKHENLARELQRRYDGEHYENSPNKEKTQKEQKCKKHSDEVIDVSEPVGVEDIEEEKDKKRKKDSGTTRASRKSRKTKKRAKDGE